MKNLFLKHKKSFLVIIGIIFFVAYLAINNIATDERSDMKKITVSIRGNNFVTWVADTETFQSRGLSGVKSLKDDQAMIFVFNESSIHPFWMKDMLIPIDIAWFDSSYKLIHVENSLAPSTYPKTFSPNSKSSYVLETKAGRLSSIGAKIGDTISFSSSK